MAGAHRRSLFLLSLAVSALAIAPAAVASPGNGVRPAANPPRHVVARSTSTNWSGYAVDGSSATQVIGTWKQPGATCSAGENSWSSPWVGIDGDTSNTVEQIGTDSDCVSGAPDYYAWYEMYPKNLVELAMPIHQGDAMRAQVTYTASGFALTLTDTTTGTSFTTTQSSRKARRSSVEWIMEGPSSGTLTDFGTVGFDNASGSIGGSTAPLGSLPNPQPITMVDNQNVVRAVPSGITGGDAFTVTWQHG